MGFVKLFAIMDGQTFIWIKKTLFLNVFDKGGSEQVEI